VIAGFEKFNRKLSSWFEWVAVCALLAIVFETFIDVIGAKLFLHPLPGAMDSAMLFQIVAVAFAATMTQIIGRHVRVEFLMGLLPSRPRNIIDSLIFLVLLIIFILIAWRSIVFGQSLQASNELSLTARIPLYPFPYLIALGCVPMCLVFLQQFLKSAVMAVKK